MLQDGASASVFWETNYVATCRFQIEYNKVQFWSKIKLAIANRTPASQSCDFVITRLISDQIALYSVQLSLSIRLPVGRSGVINSPRFCFLFVNAESWLGYRLWVIPLAFLCIATHHLNSFYSTICQQNTHLTCILKDLNGSKVLSAKITTKIKMFWNDKFWHTPSRSITVCADVKYIV